MSLSSPSLVLICRWSAGGFGIEEFDLGAALELTSFWERRGFLLLYVVQLSFCICGACLPLAPFLLIIYLDVCVVWGDWWIHCSTEVVKASISISFLSCTLHFVVCLYLSSVDVWVLYIILWCWLVDFGVCRGVWRGRMGCRRTWPFWLGIRQTDTSCPIFFEFFRQE